jgi:hypothetical protein
MAAQRKYPDELRERAVKAVLEIREREGRGHGADVDQLIKDSHDEAFDEAGPDAGTPVLRIAGKALFGPVIMPAPRSEAAGQLWDDLAMIAKTDGFLNSSDAGTANRRLTKPEP